MAKNILGLPIMSDVGFFEDKNDKIIRCSGKISCCQDQQNMIFCWIGDIFNIEKLWILENAVPMLAADGGTKIIGSPRTLPLNEQVLLNWYIPQ